MLKRLIPHFLQVPVRSYNHKPKPYVDKKLRAATESLAAKGFLRPLKPYSPPDDIDTRIDQIAGAHELHDTSATLTETPEIRFSILRSCATEFKHSVPNSKLYSIETLDDIKEFYKIPVDATTPYEALKNMDLPKNLHIQYEYKRFDPESKFLDGKSAFPKSSTIVTGLKYKNKYKGHVAKQSWP